MCAGLPFLFKSNSCWYDDEKNIFKLRIIMIVSFKKIYFIFNLINKNAGFETLHSVLGKFIFSLKCHNIYFLFFFKKKLVLKEAPVKESPFYKKGRWFPIYRGTQCPTCFLLSMGDEFILHQWGACVGFSFYFLFFLFFVY